VLQYKNLKKGYEMKLKFVLVPLVVLGFAVGSYADCSKDEVKEMIKKGISSSVINSACGKSQSKWITPSYTICKSNGGTVNYHSCKATWVNAKNICSASGGRLATIDELKKVVTDCGGTIGKFDRNIENTSYQTCYKGKGFVFSGYWSSTRFVGVGNNIWIISLYNGNVGENSQYDNDVYVRCIRDGK